ncbi:MAG TPA: Wzz/FepE/Etk N-terminal domain-containing protein [Gemmatimonadales bacterium]|nr:Wzz/FepE/Etk N-terminal domain-containing protein [Gemmatimonadales bacterium]
MSMLGLAAALLRHLRLLLLGFVLGGVVAAVWSLVATPRFSAVTIFAPGDEPASALSSGLAALGSQFGASFTMDEGTRSLQFYAELLKSHDLLAAVATDSFADPDAPTTRRPLTALLRQGGDSPERTLDNTIDFLRDEAIDVTTNDRTGMISMAVTLASPTLAADVANRLYHRLEAFNTTMRQASASGRRRFAERELASARATLENSEAEMRNFLERNRGGLDMPRLALERQRLQRRIDVAQIAFSQMTQELAEAKIAEARDNPTFTVVQVAAPPLDRSYPVRTRMTILGAIVGGCLAAVLIALLATSGTARATDPEGLAEFRGALAGLWPGRRKGVASHSP